MGTLEFRHLYSFPWHLRKHIFPGKEGYHWVTYTLAHLKLDFFFSSNTHDNMPHWPLEILRNLHKVKHWRGSIEWREIKGEHWAQQSYCSRILWKLCSLKGWTVASNCLSLWSRAPVMCPHCHFTPFYRNGTLIETVKYIYRLIISLKKNLAVD